MREHYAVLLVYSAQHPGVRNAKTDKVTKTKTFQARIEKWPLLVNSGSENASEDVLSVKLLSCLPVK
jgi:hypothetical protein